MARMKRFYGETISMTTAAAHSMIPDGYHEIKHFASSAYRLGLAPKLVHVWYFDTSASTYTDHTSKAIDKSSSAHVPLDAMQTGDILYMGFYNDCPRGVYIDMGSNVNAESATLDVEYYNGSAWTDVSGDSDGTDSGGATLAQDGLYAWTVPTDIAETAINGISLTWIRFKPSSALSATVDIDQIIPACVDTNYGYFEAGIEYHYAIDNTKVGAIETDMASGSATLNATYERT